MKIFLGMIISYVLGSIPSAYIMGRLYKGIDIRQHGSGNVGATNVFRVLGKGPGIVVLVADILKGLLAVVVVGRLLNLTELLVLILLSLSVVAGHNWPLFLKFKGGKGIATSLGVLIGLTIKIASIRPVLAITILTWILCFLVTGIVSLSSMIAATILPLVIVFTNQPVEMVVLGIIFCIFVIFRHKSNIKRLLSGQESRVSLPFLKRK